MSGDLIKLNDFASEKDEEYPILIAQRYLNIFHQIHIFNSAKKEEFDRSLLEMSDKVKKQLATMPGGRVLLEHIQEVEEARGIITDETLNLIAKDIKENKEGKSLLSPKKHNINVALGDEFTEKLASSIVNALQGAKNENKTAPEENSADFPDAIPLFCSNDAAGNITIDSTTLLKQIPCLPLLKNSKNIYAVKLYSHRLGPVISSRAVFYIDKTEVVCSGDLALYFFNNKEAKLLNIRVDKNGQLYGLRWNPVERTNIGTADLAKIHKVVAINL